MIININEKVKVKLTEYGKDIYYHQFDKFNELAKSKGVTPLKPTMPQVDSDGYTTFQLWVLMELYGPHIHMGHPLAFDTDIVIESGARMDGDAEDDP